MKGKRISGPKILERLYQIEDGLSSATLTWANMRNAKNVELCKAKRDLVRSIIEEIECKEIWK